MRMKIKKLPVAIGSMLLATNINAAQIEPPPWSVVRGWGVYDLRGGSNYFPEVDYFPAYNKAGSGKPWYLDSMRLDVGMVPVFVEVFSAIERPGSLPLTVYGDIVFTTAGGNQPDIVQTFPFEYSVNAQCYEYSCIYNSGISNPFGEPPVVSFLATKEKGYSLSVPEVSFELNVSHVRAGSVSFYNPSVKLGYNYQYDFDVKPQSMSNYTKAFGGALNDASIRAVNRSSFVSDLLETANTVKDIGSAGIMAKEAVSSGLITADMESSFKKQYVKTMLEHVYQRENLTARVDALESSRDPAAIQGIATDLVDLVSSQSFGIENKFGKAGEVLEFVEIGNFFAKTMQRLTAQAGFWLENDPPDPNYKEFPFDGVENELLIAHRNFVGKVLEKYSQQEVIDAHPHLFAMFQDTINLFLMIRTASSYEKFLGAVAVGDYEFAEMQYFSSREGGTSQRGSFDTRYLEGSASAWSRAAEASGSQAVLNITDHEILEALAALKELRDSLPESVDQTVGLDEIDTFIAKVEASDFSQLSGVTLKDAIGGNPSQDALNALSAVPELASYVYMALGLAVIFAYRGRGRYCGAE